jgi:hypothetical protein
MTEKKKTAEKSKYSCACSIGDLSEVVPVTAKPHSPSGKGTKEAGGSSDAAGAQDAADQREKTQSGPAR